MSKRAILIWQRAVAGVLAALGLWSLLGAVMDLIVEPPKHRGIPADEQLNWPAEFVVAVALASLFGIVLVAGACWLWQRPVEKMRQQDEP